MHTLVHRPHLAARSLRVLVILALAAVLAPWSASTADAEPRLQVTPADGLDPDGQQVTVRGSGFDENKGIYVAWCVVPAAGQKPSPCGGGEDRSGSSGNSVWISSNPPMYGLGLAEGYDEGGSFEVQIVVSRWIEAEDGAIDCFQVACAVTTRADHERSSDRSQDTFAAVTFDGQVEPSPAPSAPTGPPATPSPANSEPVPSPIVSDPAPRPSSTATSPSAGPEATTDTADGASEAPESTGAVPATGPDGPESESDLPTLGGDGTEPTGDTAASAPTGTAEVIAVELDQGGRSVWIVLAAVVLVLGAAVAATRTWRSR